MRTMLSPAMIQYPHRNLVMLFSQYASDLPGSSFPAAVDQWL
jgi:hypothetical protein